MKKIKVQEIFITCYLLYKQKRETRKYIYISLHKKNTRKVNQKLMRLVILGMVEKGWKEH